MALDRWLNLELCDSTGAPLAERPYALTLPDGSVREGTLDEAGALHERIPAGIERVSLDVAQRRMRLDLTGLPQADTVAGAQERLNHLNYFVGDVDGQVGRFTTGAIERFQRDHRLAATGELNEATAATLRRAHGA